MRRLAILALLLVALPNAWAQFPTVPQDDAYSGGDAGDTFDTATWIEPPAHPFFPGTLSPPNDTEDWYQFNVTAEWQMVTVSFTLAATLCQPDPLGPTTIVQVEIWDPSRNLRAQFDTAACAAHNSISAPADVAGPWRVAFKYYAPAILSPPIGLLGARAASPIPGATIQADAGAAGPVLGYVFGIDPWCEPAC